MRLSVDSPLQKPTGESTDKHISAAIAGRYEGWGWGGGAASRERFHRVLEACGRGSGTTILREISSHKKRAMGQRFSLRRATKNEERFLSTQADTFAGANVKEKASACFVRNDGVVVRMGMEEQQQSKRDFSLRPSRLRVNRPTRLQEQT
jgi:hypothetical protein